MCPHNNQECIHEIYVGEPGFYKWCKKCSVYKSMQNIPVKESKECKRFAKKIIKLQKIYNEVCIEQAKINRYGCNAKILSASKINELHTDGNRFEQCAKCCNEKNPMCFLYNNRKITAIGYKRMEHFTKYCKPVALANDWKDDKRPSKDEYYLGFAKAAAIRGTCLRRNYGAVIVKNDEIVSTGYTGAPRGRYNCNEIGRCVRMEKGIPSGQRYEMCRSVHAEMNAIISASRDKMIGATLYLYGWDVEHNCEKTDPVPCSLCERMIINAGIEEVVALNPLYTEGGKEPKIKHYKVKDYIECDESLQYLIETAESGLAE